MAKLKPAAKFSLIMVLFTLIASASMYFTKTGIFDDGTSVKRKPTTLVETKSPPIKEEKSTIKDKLTPSPAPTTFPKKETIRVGIVTWPGYAGGQYFNRGFKANSQSRYLEKYGFNVEFVVIDDMATSRDAWKADEIHVLWTTVDSFSTEVDGLLQYKPKIIMQADWSRGGDVIVASRGIEKVNDLKGKTVAVAFSSPSHTFLIKSLEYADMSLNDIKIVEASSAVDAAEYFKSKKVDAAVVWSPDDESCLSAVKGSKVLVSTADAKNIIADVFIAKESFIRKYPDEIKGLIEGWMIGASEINTLPAAKVDAAQILSNGLNMPYEYCLNSLKNVRLATYGDNINFFGLNTSYTGMKGEEIYNDMSAKFASLNYGSGKVSWRKIVDLEPLNSISSLKGFQHEAELVEVKVKNIESDIKKESFSNKKIEINFLSGSSSLSNESQTVIEEKLVPMIKMYGTKVRIEGNTDNIGNEDSNTKLSYSRANSVVDYLVKNHNFNKDLFIVVGNGSKKPISSNLTPEGRAENRRTEIHLIR